MEKIHRYSGYSQGEALLYNSSFLDWQFISEIFNNKCLGRYEYRESCITEGRERGLDAVSIMTLLDQQNYMVSILNRQDKMSMAASIESRVPFLDFRIVELSNKMPASYKMKYFQTKNILKKVAGNFLPRKIINRRKSGFGVPMQNWLNEPNGLVDT